MLKNRDRIDRLHIASPCPMGWERMAGDERVRFCNQCSLHVYNISEMTRAETESLISETEGRICGRLYRRADGTVLTKDCPVGLRAVRRRVSRVAGAAITAIFSFCVSVMGQQSSQEDKSPPSGTQITRRASTGQMQDNRATLVGVVKDPNNAVIPGATVILIKENAEKKLLPITTVITDSEGKFKFPSLQAGSYYLKAEVMHFKPSSLEKITVQANEEARIELTMNLSTEIEVFVGVIGYADELFLHTATSDNKTIFTHKQITRLPF